MSTSPPRRDYLPLAERRERLLDAATEVVAASGASALSLRNVAERAGVAHRVVHYAFGSKTGLVEALLHRASARTLERAWAGALRESDLPTAVASALRAIAADARAHADDYRVTAELVALAHSTPELRSAADAEVTESRRAIESAIDDWTQRTGGRLPVPRETMGLALRAAADGVVSAWFDTRDAAAVDAVAGVLASGFSAAET